MAIVTKIDYEFIQFDNGLSVISEHSQSCCESHYLAFNEAENLLGADIPIENFDESFFERVEGYGIRLIQQNGHPISVPGYGINNGYYGSNIELVVKNESGKEIASFDVSECQDYA